MSYMVYIVPMFIGFYIYMWVGFVVGLLLKFVFASETPMFHWWPEAESNCRPLVFQTSALPTELSGQIAGTTGFEPATSCVTGRREL